MTRALPIAILALTLGGCSSAGDVWSTAGTAVTFEGQICGQAANFTLTDMKDRSQATARVECPGGGSIEITTADSSTSAVIMAQAEAIAKSADAIGALIGAAAGAAVGLPPVGLPAPPPALAPSSARPTAAEEGQRLLWAISGAGA